MALHPTKPRCPKGGLAQPHRRALLRAGVIGGLGLSLPALMAARAGRSSQTRAAEAPGPMPGAGFGRAKRCILIYLTGGPPQLDTFDPKPDAPAEVRGEFSPIATRTPGLLATEYYPQLAARSDKYCIVRSVTHADTVHTSAGYTMLTGVYHPNPNEKTAQNIRPQPDDHPHLGSLLSLVRENGAGRSDSRTGEQGEPNEKGENRGVALPPFVSLPEVIRDAGVNTYPGQDGGMLGKRHGPLRVEANSAGSALRTPEIILPADMSRARLNERRALLRATFRGDGSLGDASLGKVGREVDEYYSAAYDLLNSNRAATAFDVSQEPPRLVEAYGKHLLGQGCLLARRLVEAEVGLVTVYWHYEGPEDSPVWDTHGNNFTHLRQRLMPPTDQAVSALLDDLDARGLLDDTLVLMMGEFGRTPRVNKLAGRDHWPGAQSILLAGAGTPRGTFYGATDRIGGLPADRPVSPPDLTATLLHRLGVPLDMWLTSPLGRPVPVCQGRPIGELFS